MTTKENPGVSPGALPTTTDTDEVRDPPCPTTPAPPAHLASFVALGRPMPFARPRFHKGRSFDDPAYAAAKEALGILALKAARPPLGNPVAVTLTFLYARPEFGVRVGERFFSRAPDVDNLAKTVLDALNGIWWDDDRRVYRLVAEKRWGIEDRTEIVARWEAAEAETTTTKKRSTRKVKP